MPFPFSPTLVQDLTVSCLMAQIYVPPRTVATHVIFFSFSAPAAGCYISLKYDVSLFRTSNPAFLASSAQTMLLPCLPHLRALLPSARQVVFLFFLFPKIPLCCMLRKLITHPSEQIEEGSPGPGTLLTLHNGDTHNRSIPL